MKKSINYITAAAILALGTTLAHADGEQCDTQGHTPSHSSMDNIMFKSIDTDGDGSISKAEFDAYYEKRNEKHFAEVDTNKDGKLTPDEMAPTPSAPVTGTTHLDRRFNAADANHDGGLDRTEAKDMPMLVQYFKQVDANKDGKVTRQEYFDAMPLLHSGKGISADGKTQAL